MGGRFHRDIESRNLRARGIFLSFAGCPIVVAPKEKPLSFNPMPFTLNYFFRANKGENPLFILTPSPPSVISSDRKERRREGAGIK